MGHPIPVKPTQLKIRPRKCNYSEKHCDISLVKYLWPCELAEISRSPCCSSIFKDSSSWSIALSCLTVISKMITNKRNHLTCITFQIRATISQTLGPHQELLFHTRNPYSRAQTVSKYSKWLDKSKTLHLASRD